MCACVSPPPPPTPPNLFFFVLFVFLSFDGSETLIKIDIIGFTLHPTNGSPPPPVYAGFPIHPQGCLELEAFFLFQDRIQNSFFYSSHESVFQSSARCLSPSSPPPPPMIKLGEKEGGGGGGEERPMLIRLQPNLIYWHVTKGLSVL